LHFNHKIFFKIILFPESKKKKLVQKYLTWTERERERQTERERESIDQRLEGRK